MSRAPLYTKAQQERQFAIEDVLNTYRDELAWAASNKKVAESFKIKDRRKKWDEFYKWYPVRTAPWPRPHHETLTDSFPLLKEPSGQSIALRRSEGRKTIMPAFMVMTEPLNIDWCGHS